MIVIVLVIVAKAINDLRGTESFASMNTGFQLLFLFLPFICWIGVIVFGLALLYDSVNIIMILQKGKFVEFASKKEILGMVMKCIKGDDDSTKTRCVGKTYKNIGGNIYFIKQKTCPFCQTKPIGKMHLIKDISNAQYQWVCSEQLSHREEFDYKKEF